MPTRIATLGRERTVATLARRLYTIEGEDKAELQRRAEAALLRANPRLASGEGFRSGGRVVVPAVIGLKRTDEVTTASEPSADALNSEMALRLRALGSRIEDSFSRDRQAREKTTERIGARDFKAEARKALPESAKVIDQTLDRLKQAESETKVVEERLAGAVGSALEGLEAIEQLFRKSSPR
jgi:hypothetical protein